MKRARDFRQDLSDYEDAMATATGPAELALGGNREALKAWAAIASAYLRSQSSDEFQPSQHGFPEGYDDQDASGCISHLADVFDRIHNGEEPNRAFGWNTGKKGRPRRTQSNPGGAMMDDWRLEDVGRLVATGLSVSKACEIVASEKKDSADRLEQLYKRSR